MEEKVTHADNPSTSSHAAHEYADVRTLISWSAPGRPYRKKGKDFYLSMILIAMLIEVILFLFSEYMLMLVPIALVFLSSALALTPPRNFHYKITSEGVQIEDYFYIWSELYDFHFKKIDAVDTLVITTHDFLPGELKLPLGDNNRDHMRRVLIRYLPFREVVKQTFVEKSADWLAKTFPLESSK